ncbi:MAG: TIGR00341 family protein [Bacteroidetes Order II. Incertae sedis bacterium]|nr:TIGR00341 family protein [Bacteroidetes Order II. bacterium]
MLPFLKFIDLHEGEESKDLVLENVKANISFRGSNFWILIGAIIIASIGLNVNSTAVIIGAMLISPLMGPIVGAGFGLGTQDLVLLRRSLKNLFVSTFASLITATLYFYFSPFKEVQSELLARTSPNIYDVLIAFFGGLVGVIAITRVEKGNPIPGVAIATALMPPLCTAGFGLATGNLSFFAGAFYLYLINCVFICISTLIIVKYLKYPAKEQLDEQSRQRIRYSITFIILILVIPSIYLAFNLWNERNIQLRIERFIQEEFYSKGYTIIYKSVDTQSSRQKIDLAFLNKRFSDLEIDQYKNKLSKYQLGNTDLVIRQDTTNLKNLITQELNNRGNTFTQKNSLNEWRHYLQDGTYDSATLLAELKTLFPEIEALSIANHTLPDSSRSLVVVPVMVYYASAPLGSEAEQRLKNWLMQRFQKKQALVVRAPLPEGTTP